LKVGIGLFIALIIYYYWKSKVRINRKDSPTQHQVRQPNRSTTTTTQRNENNNTLNTKIEIVKENDEVNGSVIPQENLYENEDPLVGINVGEIAPPIRVNIDKELFDLNSYRKKSWVILFFYSANFETIDELVYFQENLTEINDNLHSTIIGCAVHSEFQQAGIKLKYNLQYPLLHDPDFFIGKKYNIAIQDKKYQPTCLIIDPNGKIIHREETKSAEKKFSHYYKN